MTTKRRRSTLKRSHTEVEVYVKRKRLSQRNNVQDLLQEISDIEETDTMQNNDALRTTARNTN